MQKTIQRVFIALMAVLPTLALAHSGHDHQVQAGFWTGFIHPFTGLDHFMMALALGALLWKVTTQWRVMGALGFAVALVAGFSLGAAGGLASNVTEYGIIASLAVLAFAMLKKTSLGFVLASLSLAGFHGVAHGTELTANGQLALQVFGMIAAMLSILGLGLGTGAFIQRFIPHGEKVIGAVLMCVALIGFA